MVNIHQIRCDPGTNHHMRLDPGGMLLCVGELGDRWVMRGKDRIQRISIHPLDRCTQHLRKMSEPWMCRDEVNDTCHTSPSWAF
ncbi:MAG: hypothetical protein Fur005_36580 [Roseiflexaceae bacterium]